VSRPAHGSGWPGRPGIGARRGCSGPSGAPWVAQVGPARCRVSGLEVVPGRGARDRGGRRLSVFLHYATCHVAPSNTYNWLHRSGMFIDVRLARICALTRDCLPARTKRVQRPAMRSKPPLLPRILSPGGHLPIYSSSHQSHARERSLIVKAHAAALSLCRKCELALRCAAIAY
jgi:hypothetical protein